MSVSIPNIDEWFITGGYLASARIKNHPQALLFSALPSTVRLLLATDGTVTKSLEALFWEPVSVDLNRQAWITRQPPWCQPDEKDALLLDRQVFLVGQQTQRVYSFAKSYINADCLDDHLRDALINERLGIGELLRRSYYEQYRKITDIGWHQPDAHAETKAHTECSGVNSVLAQPCVYRTYTVTSQRKILMQITEYFPIALFSSSHQQQPRLVQPF